MNKFLKQLLRFFLILITLMILKTILVKPTISNKVYATKYNDYLAKSVSKDYNTLFFGSSRIYRHIDPEQFDSLGTDYNLSSYNLGAPATFNPELYFIYDRFLDDYEAGVVSDSIKYVFIELQRLNNLTLDNALTDQGSYWNNLDNLVYSIKYILDYHRKPKQKIKSVTNYIVSFFNNFLNIYVQDNNYKYELDLKDGYLSLEDELKFSSKIRLDQRRTDFLNESEELFERTVLASYDEIKQIENGKIINSLYERLNYMISRSKKNGIQLYLIIPPRQELNTYKDLIPLALVFNTSVINLSSSTEYPELYRFDSSFDIGHLNNKGVKYFTNYLYMNFEKSLQ